MRSVFFTVFALGLIVVCGRAAPTDKPKDNLEGTWEVLEFVMNGDEMPEKERKAMRFVVKGDKLSLSGLGDKREFTVKLDPTKKPKAIDFVSIGGPYDGQTGPGIYDLDGDALKLCVPNAPTKDRPTEFKSEKGAVLAYMVLKRMKPGK
jgi:uncharacterized protein (TIGR03067 family)